MSGHTHGEYGCYIDGEERPGEDAFAVLDPSTNDPVATAAEGGREGIDAALSAAEGALPEWRAMDPSDRGRLLREVADAVRERADDLAELGTAETGRPLRESRLFARNGAKYLDYYAGLTDKIEGKSVPVGEGYLDYTRLEPLGITGQIIPWNAPALLSLRGIAPALACGNAVVAKPAPEAPLVATEIARIASEAGLPDGVWNVVPGDGATTGAALTGSDRVDKVVFTGSVETARAVMKSAADHLTPVGLETGGKSPSLVFPDADLDSAVEDTLGVFAMAGQVCFATTRVFVHEDVYDEFADRVAAATEELTTGPGTEDPDVGPLITREARDRVAAYVTEAVEDGPGRVLAGGEIPREAGNFYAPTVVEGVPDDAPLSCDEVFGPVFTLYEFSDEDEAVRRANDTRYGLYATVWTRDLARAHRVAGRLEAGSVSVNEFPVTPPQAPFGGYKESGIGREKGTQAIREYTQTKNVVVSLDG
ncbi:MULTISPECIES: aldehyde dehydrogenase [Halorussus]|uniref:aldehyde dehydrogenase family protein n=1 Tax=Halorussus TaxID=1070314 RepID=UPI000E20CE07|nr:MULTISPECIES: aldehyde dehydrogenase family protein [Halorussus]NHN59856.1 aldehyde dehydrogenase [Halorussus sp. JP-T4]